jgi:hypothetical protein
MRIVHDWSEAMRVYGCIPSFRILDCLLSNGFFNLTSQGFVRERQNRHHLRGPERSVRQIIENMIQCIGRGVRSTAFLVCNMLKSCMLQVFHVFVT